MQAALHDTIGPDILLRLWTPSKHFCHVQFTVWVATACYAVRQALTKLSFRPYCFKHCCQRRLGSAAGTPPPPIILSTGLSPVATVKLLKASLHRQSQSKHTVFFRANTVVALHYTLCAGGQLQASTESCRHGIQRSPILRCQLFGQHGWSQLYQIHGKLKLCCAVAL